MIGRAWTRYAVFATVFVCGYQLIPDNGWWRVGWQVGIGYTAVAAVLIGVRSMPARDRVPWRLLATGVFGNATGIAVLVYTNEVLHYDGMPTPADPLFLTLYPAYGLGLAIMIQRRESRRDWSAMVDSATITTGLGLLAWVYVIQQAATGEMSTLGHVVQIAYPVGDLVLLAIAIRLLRGGGVRGAAFWWICGSLGCFLLGDTTWAVLGQFDLDPSGTPIVGRGIDMIFLFAFALVGVAALHPTARELTRRTDPAPPRLSRTLLALLTVVSLIAPAILIVQVLMGTVTNGIAIAVGSAVLFLLVVTRMAQLLREVERQSRRVRELARRDELTGLPNRRTWNDELPRTLERARRDEAPVSVALLDLDHFKRFNDSYGHPAGDRLLKEAAAAWHGAIRAADTLARYGGEEFIVLLPHTGTEEAVQVLERALAATPLGQTFSAGVATWDRTETSDELIARADAALYAAKAGGRCRVHADTTAAGRPERSSSSR
jgi:diguanylate cyclase (GGDEF)-like protein